MNKPQIVIIDNEHTAAQHLYNLIKKLRPSWEVSIIGDTIDSAVQWISSNAAPDLLFLHLQLRDETIPQLIKQILPTCPIVFTTISETDTIHSFNINNIPYLIKPFDEQALNNLLEKFESFSKLTLKNATVIQETLLEVLESNAANKQTYRKRFMLSSGERIWPLQTADVAYFTSRNRITIATTRTGEEHLIDYTLDKLIDQLDPNQFFRANRQIILHIDSVNKIEPYYNSKVIVITTPPTSEKIMVSKEKLPRFKEWLNF